MPFYQIGTRGEGGKGRGFEGYWELWGYREIRGEECEGIKGMTYEIQPVELEWTFPPLFFILAGCGGRRRDGGNRR